MDLGGGSQFPCTQLPAEAEGDRRGGTSDCRSPISTSFAAGRGRARGRASGTRSLSGPSQSQCSAPHKVRGPNWTEAEMLVLIGEKRTEWDGRHNCSQPALAKFVYGTTAWKLVLAGCMAAVGFRERDADQLTNKWDGLIKEYKKLNDYIEGSGSANWWGMSREEKKELSRTRKMPLEFTELIYAEMESFVGKRQIFGKALDVVDSGRPAAPMRKAFGRSPPATFAPSCAPARSPTASATTTPSTTTPTTPGDDTPGSTGRKRKSSSTDNLVDYMLGSSIVNTFPVWPRRKMTSACGGMM